MQCYAILLKLTTYIHCASWMLLISYFCSIFLESRSQLFQKKGYYRQWGIRAVNWNSLSQSRVEFSSEMNIKESDILAEDVREGEVSDPAGQSIRHDREEKDMEVVRDDDDRSTDGDTYRNPSCWFADDVVACGRLIGWRIFRTISKYWQTGTYNIVVSIDVANVRNRNEERERTRSFQKLKRTFATSMVVSENSDIGAQSNGSMSTILFQSWLVDRIPLGSKIGWMSHWGRCSEFQRAE